MLRKILTITISLIMGLSLAACGTSTNNNGKDAETKSETQTVQEQVSVSEDNPAGETVVDVVTDEIADTDIDPINGLAEPVLEWWDLYNPNGFDTLTGAISNPNDVDVDISYDIVFYKDGSEVSRIEYCDSFSVAAGGETLIWANVDVPAAEDADDVKLENVYVSEAGDPAIDGTYEYVGETDGNAYFDFTFDSQPTIANIWFVLYNDNNANGKPDRGETVVADTAFMMEQTGRVSFETNVYPYTDYAVYYSAY